MIRIAQGILLGIVLLLTQRAGAQLPACYHTLEELYDSCFALQEQYPDSVRIDSIGHSRGDLHGNVYPIYAVKISDSANTFQNEPVALIIAHIHAEEVIGMEATMRYMRRLLTPPYRDIFRNVQVYVIPTMNPDGLSVISEGLDMTWRKNGYHPPEMGGRDCNVWPGVGRDSCGVDLNRNFELNWIYGDTLWKPDAAEPFDYYRGPSPFSEPEAQAVRDFALRIRPTVSIVYHSSRSGNVAERSIIAWQWGTDPGPYKFPPDSASLDLWNRRYVSLAEKYPGPGNYLFVWGGTHNGDLQDWFYWRIGTFQALTETSPNGGEIQPACDILDATISAMEPSLEWMQRRLLNLDQDAPAPLAIYTKDAATNQAISAEWRIVNTWNAGLAARTTNEEFGRMTILPPQGPITIKARKDGYADTTATTTIQPGGSPQSLTLRLRPLAQHSLTIRFTDGSGNGIQGNVYVDNGFPKFLAIPSGGLTTNQPEGAYRIRAFADDQTRVAAWREFYLGEDMTFDIVLPGGTVRWTEDFDNGLTNWTHGGEGDNWRIDPDTTLVNLGPGVHTNAEGFRAVYPNNANSWLRYSSPLDLSNGNMAMLKFFRRGRMEVPFDSLFVEVSTDGDNWEKADGFCDMDRGWTTTYVNLTRWMPNAVHLRFRLVSDHALGELGMHLDHIQLYVGTDLDVPVPPSPQPEKYELKKAYPNPFNPSVTIEYNLGRGADAKIAIYNILGEQVRVMNLPSHQSGPGRIVWNGTNSSGLDVPSGLYFARMEAADEFSLIKLLLVR